MRPLNGPFRQEFYGIKLYPLTACRLHFGRLPIKEFPVRYGNAINAGTPHAFELWIVLLAKNGEFTRYTVSIVLLNLRQLT